MEQFIEFPLDVSKTPIHLLLEMKDVQAKELLVKDTCAF